MSGVMAPTDEAGVVEVVRAAVADRAPLAVEGQWHQARHAAAGAGGAAGFPLRG
jgi:hypothetical protein